MGTRENKVERYLDDQVKLLGGITRKWVCPYYDGVPDRICFLNPEWYVEVKTVDGVQELHQQREAQRLSDSGARVAIVYGHSGVDKFITMIKNNRHTQYKVQLVFK